VARTFEGSTVRKLDHDDSDEGSVWFDLRPKKENRGGAERAVLLHRHITIVQHENSMDLLWGMVETRAA
jgi:hypothetical protein